MEEEGETEDEKRLKMIKRKNKRTVLLLSLVSAECCTNIYLGLVTQVSKVIHFVQTTSILKYDYLLCSLTLNILNMQRPLRSRPST